MRGDPTVGLGFRFGVDEVSRLDALARATGRTRASVVRALVRLASPRKEGDLVLLREALHVMDREGSDVDGKL